MFVDPVPIIQKEIDATVNKMMADLQNRKDILNDPRGGNIDVFTAIGIQISNDVQIVRTTLQDIESSINAVRNHTSDIQLSEQVLQQRETYIRMVRGIVTKIENEIASQNQQSMRLRNDHLFSQKTEAGNGFENVPENSGSFQQATMTKDERILQLERDAQLNYQVGVAIKNELHSQKQLLVDLDEGVTNATDAMEKVTKQIKDIIDAEGKTPTMTVALLSVVFIILLFFVI
jgi:hypothetical protein